MWLGHMWLIDMSSRMLSVPRFAFRMMVQVLVSDGVYVVNCYGMVLYSKEKNY